jgi:hypothetical protein
MMPKVTIADVFREVVLVKQSQETSNTAIKELKEALTSHTIADQANFHQLQESQSQLATEIALLKASGSSNTSLSTVLTFAGGSLTSILKFLAGIATALIAAKFGVNISNSP